MINHRSEKSEPLSCQPVSNFRTGFMSNSGSQIQKLVLCQTQVVKFKNWFRVRLRWSNSKTSFMSDSGSQIQKLVLCQTQVVKFKNQFHVRLR